MALKSGECFEQLKSGEYFELLKEVLQEEENPTRVLARFSMAHANTYAESLLYLCSLNYSPEELYETRFLHRAVDTDTMDNAIKHIKDFQTDLPKDTLIHFLNEAREERADNMDSPVRPALEITFTRTNLERLYKFWGTDFLKACLNRYVDLKNIPDLAVPGDLQSFIDQSMENLTEELFAEINSWIHKSLVVSRKAVYSRLFPQFFQADLKYESLLEELTKPLQPLQNESSNTFTQKMYNEVHQAYERGKIQIQLLENLSGLPFAYPKDERQLAHTIFNFIWSHADDTKKLDLIQQYLKVEQNSDIKEEISGMITLDLHSQENASPESTVGNDSSSDKDKQNEFETLLSQLYNNDAQLDEYLDKITSLEQRWQTLQDFIKYCGKIQQTIKCPPQAQPSIDDKKRQRCLAQLERTIKEIKQQQQDLQSIVDKPDEKNALLAYQTATKLLNTITLAKQTLIDNKRYHSNQVKLFVKICQSSITMAQPTLVQYDYPQWKVILQQLAGVLVSMLSFGMVNIITGRGPLTLFKPGTAVNTKAPLEHLASNLNQLN